MSDLEFALAAILVALYAAQLFLRYGEFVLGSEGRYGLSYFDFLVSVNCSLESLLIQVADSLAWQMQTTSRLRIDTFISRQYQCVRVLGVCATRKVKYTQKKDEREGVIPVHPLK